jgi:DNA-binding beta-propeller fold protein YncE
LYVADARNKRILMYLNNAGANQIPTVIISNISCYSLFVDKYDSLYFTDAISVKILNHTTGNVTLFANSYYDTRNGNFRQLIAPSGLYVDNNLTIYVADSGAGSVVRFLGGNPNNGTIIGSQTVVLQIPECIFVDETDNNAVYICESNSRILKYTNAAQRWTTVAGNGGSGGISLNALSYPSSIIIDPVNQEIYIADTGNNRIVRWSLSSNTQQGEIVIQFSSLSSPTAIKFDNNKNLYGAFGLLGNGKISKFINCCINVTLCQFTQSSSPLSLYIAFQKSSFLYLYFLFLFLFLLSKF